MKFREIVSFEIEQQLRRLTTLGYFVILGGLTLVLNFGLAEGPRHVNSPLTVASVSALMGLAGMLITAALFTDAATRDANAIMHPLMYTEPISKIEYLGGRFVGALVVNLLVFLAIPIAQLLALVVPPIEGPETYLPFDVATYVEPFMLFTVPNLLITSVILFSIAALTRRALATYLIAVALGLGYIVAIEMQTHFDRRVMAAMTDPFGVIAITHHVRFWTPAEKSVWQIGSPPLVVMNRLLWSGIAVALFLMLHWKFRLALPASGRWRFMKRSKPELELSGDAEAVVVPAAARRFDRRNELRQLLEIARLSLRDILRSRLFLWIAAAGVGMVFLFGLEVGGAIFETATWPVTHLIAASTLGMQASFVFIALITLYAGELVWRNRDVRMQAIADGAPVAEWVTLAGYFLALTGMIVILQAVMMVSGMALQAVQGYYRFEPSLYIRILFGFTLPNYLLFAALAMAVHVIVDQKFIGHFVVVVLFALTVFADALGVRHHLLVYGSDPGWVYSDMNGFGPFVAPFVWFKLYWAAWALLLAIVASAFHVRGTDRGFRQRTSRALQRLTGPTARAAGVVAVLIAALGAFIFYNTNVLNDYPRSGESQARMAAYERMYKQFENAPQPLIVANTMRVEIYPERRAVDIDGTYRLANRTGRSIDSLLVLLPRDLEIRTVALDREARLVLDDDSLQVHIYALSQPLLPGDSLNLTYALTFAPRGFPNDDINTSVAANGAYFDRRWLPYIGYQPSRELTDNALRKELGLPAQAADPDFSDSTARQLRFPTRNEDLVHLDAVIGTDANQVAITPGSLVKEWSENGRRYFQYRTESPLPHGAPFLSARYAVREDTWNGVALRILHHPSHDYNVDRLMRSMKASLAYFTTNFGPYPFRELRIVEFPRYASFARAHPYTIAFSEGSSFLTRVEDWDVDRPFFVTAHETAHQWWGVELSGARVKGAALLTETLAQYSSMMVLEKTYGMDHVRRFYDFSMEYYLAGRGTDAQAEVPMLDVGSSDYLYYQKGAVVMYTLREAIGEQAVNQALRTYLAKYRNAGPPFPTSRDLYRELQAVTPDSLRGLLSDLFEHVTMTEVVVDSAHAKRRGADQWDLTLYVSAKKVRIDSAGVEHEIPMNDHVELGAFRLAADGKSRGDTLHLERRRIRSGAQVIMLTTKEAPGIAGIDPFRKLIQRTTTDNTVTVEVDSLSGANRRLQSSR